MRTGFGSYASTAAHLLQPQLRAHRGRNLVVVVFEQQLDVLRERRIGLVPAITEVKAEELKKVCVEGGFVMREHALDR